jgi:hypothetical protein
LVVFVTCYIPTAAHTDPCPTDYTDERVLALDADLAHWASGIMADTHFAEILYILCRES